MKAKLKCGAPMRTAQLHPSIRIGGVTLERCERDVLPTMTVCELHASPDAVRIAMTALAARRAS